MLNSRCGPIATPYDYFWHPTTLVDYGRCTLRFGNAAISLLLGSDWKLYDPGRTLRRPHVPLAEAHCGRELVRSLEAPVAPYSKQLDGERGSIHRHAVGHGAGRLRASLEETAGTPYADGVHADDPDAAGNRLRDPVVYRVHQDQPREYAAWPDSGRHDIYDPF